MAFADLSAEITGVLPGLSGLLADSFVARALRGIYAERLWSFQIAEAGVYCPAQITTSTAAITQFSATVTMSAAATTALAAVVTQPGLANMQIRFGASGNAAVSGQVYNILSGTGSPLVLTLDRVVMEPTNALSSYQCYRSIVVAPVADFVRWDAVIDMANAINVCKDFTSAYFDARDPQRTAQGQAYFIGHYEQAPLVGSNLAGIPRYELWPVPVQGQTFYTRYKRRGPGFVNPGDIQPDVISDNVIIHRTLYEHAYPWAMANQGNFPTLKGVNWGQLIRDRVGMYKDAMVHIRRTDDDIRLQSMINRGHGLRNARSFPFPIDANFIQSHLVPI